MPKIPPAALVAVQKAYAQFIEEVEASPVARATKDMYTGHVRGFVRWLDDDYTPGAGIARRGK